MAFNEKLTLQSSWTSLKGIITETIRVCQWRQEIILCYVKQMACAYSVCIQTGLGSLCTAEPEQTAGLSRLSAGKCAHSTHPDKCWVSQTHSMSRDVVEILAFSPLGLMCRHSKYLVHLKVTDVQNCQINGHVAHAVGCPKVTGVSH